MPGEHGIWTRVGDVFVTEMSTYEGSGRPDPLTGRTMYAVQLTQMGTGDERYWEGRSPVSGSFIRIFND